MAGRIAGDNPGYTFRLCRMTGKGKNPIARPTPWGFDLVSVTTFIGEVMGKPAGAMSYWGFRIGMQGVMEALADGEDLGDLEADDMETLLKARGVSPNMSRDSAGDRGNNAHSILGWLADEHNDYRPRPEEPDLPVLIPPSFRTLAEAYAEDEERTEGTRYGWAVIEWWDECVQPYINSGEITEVVSERPVWSLRHRFSGTFDLALYWNNVNVLANGWEIIDLKTHKPADGFTKEGKGPGYVSEAAQIKAYRIAHEEMGLGRTIGQRTLVVREKKYRGKNYLEDYREVSEKFVILVREAYEEKQQFEEGDAE